MIDRKELLRLVEEYLRQNVETDSARALGMRISGDPTFIYHLRDGREPRESTRLKILKAIGHRE